VLELLRRPLLGLTVVGGAAAMLSTSYLAASAIITDRATRATRTPVSGSPADVNLPFEEVAFPSADDRLQLAGWYVPAHGARERAVIVIHGIDQNRWTPWENTSEKVRLLAEHGFDVLLFDLRGHGESAGERLGFGWLERNDVRGAVDFLRQRGIAAGRIGVLAHSYGAASALLAAAVVPEVAAVVADSAFADMRPLLDHEFRLRGIPPIFTRGIAFVGSRRFGVDLDVIAPEQQVARIAPRPILFIHGAADARIPADNSRQLFAAARNPSAELWVVPDAGHVQAFAHEPELYTRKVLGFFEANLGP
jgi:pimeloyl-ACP methyl ester carboxylesterase